MLFAAESKSASVLAHL
jgi:hypothetical protein